MPKSSGRDGHSGWDYGLQPDDRRWAKRAAAKIRRRRGRRELQQMVDELHQEQIESVHEMLESDIDIYWDFESELEESIYDLIDHDDDGTSWPYDDSIEPYPEDYTPFDYREYHYGNTVEPWMLDRGERRAGQTSAAYLVHDSGKTTCMWVISVIRVESPISRHSYYARERWTMLDAITRREQLMSTGLYREVRLELA